jgi:hypothetical protein
MYSSSNIMTIKKDEAEGHALCMGDGRNAYTILVGKPEEKRSLGRPRGRWEDNIKMNLIGT